MDENAHAVHFFISALLQLLDRAGSLYGEIARFVLRVVFRRRASKQMALDPGGVGTALTAPRATSHAGGVLALSQGSPTSGSRQWDNVWGASSR